MKLSKTLSSLLCVMLAVILCAGMIPSSAMALQKKECRVFSTATALWLYVPSTVPDTVELREWSEWASFDGDKTGTEFGRTCSIEFVSGDEALKDALKYKTYTSDFWDAGTMKNDLPMMDLYIENAALTEPGEAVFHVKVQSEHFTDEGDISIRVLSWDEYPLLVPKDGSHAVNAQVGDFVDERDIAAAVADLRVDEVAAALESKGVKLEDKPSSSFRISNWPSSPIVEEYDNIDEYITMTYYYHQEAERVRGYNVKDYGTADFDVSYSGGNIRFEAKAQIVVAGYRITGPKTVRPGETAQYQVVDAGGEGRTFTVTCEADGEVYFSEEELLLVTTEDTPDGTSFRLTATPSDGGEPAVLEGKITSSLFAGEAYELQYFADGFSVPQLSDQTVYFTGKNKGDLFSQTRDETGPYIIAINYRRFNPLEEFAELYPRFATDLYDTLSISDMEVTGSEDFEIDGHPARLIVGHTSQIHMGVMWYVRNDRAIRAMLRVFPMNGTALSNVPAVTMEDVEAVARQIAYDPSKAEITVADGALAISAKGNETALTAGKKIAFTAAFANTGKVNKKAKNDKIEWSVTDTATGKAPEDVTIDAKGSLSAAKTLKEVRNVEVKASSPIFHTSATYAVTVIPAVTKVTAKPAAVFFYTGTDAQETVQAVLDPDTVPPVGITWKLKKAGVVELTAGEDGTAVLKPVAAGKTAVTVTEPGGKNAAVNVTVTDAVTSVELTPKGKSAPGGAVTVAAVLQPKTAGNKQLQWSVDVGEDIATVNEKGQVKISKTAPAGTVFHVTCTALGAPEPVSATVEITVAGK